MTYIFIENNGVTELVGQLFSDFSTGTERSSFKYASEWLNSQKPFAIEPGLQLTADLINCKPDLRIFSGLADTSHDAWCRSLIKHASGAKKLHQIDYLLGMDDYARFGALRFKHDRKGPFLSDSPRPIPPVFVMQELLHAKADELSLLINPPSDLDVFRPKASVLSDDGNLWLAKFSQASDENSVMLWEAVALTIAAQAKIQVPQLMMQNLHGNNVLLTARFDRIGNKRQHYLTGTGLLNTRDDAQHSYVELAHAIKQNCANPAQDLHALWRRIVFNILISNFDDHLRNHGFLYNNGWSLAPLFDATPQAMPTTYRLLATKIDQQKDATLDQALAVASQFDLNQAQAKTIIAEVAHASQNWRAISSEFKITKAEIEMFAQAFEHAELELALKLYSS